MFSQPQSCHTAMTMAPEGDWQRTPTQEFPPFVRLFIGALGRVDNKGHFAPITEGFKLISGMKT